MSNMKLFLETVKGNKNLLASGGYNTIGRLNLVASTGEVAFDMLDAMNEELEALQAERDALRKLIHDLKLGAECYLTAVADLQAGYTPDTHPDWNAVQYLAGEAHAAILRANDVLGVDAGGDTAVDAE